MTVLGVIAQLEAMDGLRFHWDPGGVRGSIHRWLTSTPQRETPEIVTGGVQCFGLPIYVAYELAFLTFEQASTMYSDLLIQAGEKKFPVAVCPDGGTQLYFGSFCCVPLRRIKGGPASFPRGAAVFFSTEKIKYIAHFAVATGNGTEMMSFGHGATLSPASLPVERQSLQEILDAYGNLISECHFGMPNW